MQMNLEELKKKIEEANIAYRTGEAVMSDEEYDALLDELSERTAGVDPLIKAIGFTPSDSRKEELPVPMYSMNKVKNGAEFLKWWTLKKIPQDTQVVIMPKFDGLSLCVDEKNNRAWTRGNGVIGQRSDSHLEMLMSNKKKSKLKSGFSLGEVIMKKKVFQKKWKKIYKNSRNMGAGALNKKEAEEELKDFEYMRFAYIPRKPQHLSKKDQLDFLNKNANSKSIKYELIEIDKITDDLLLKTFEEFSDEFEIDGLIIEVDNPELRSTLGRETNGNPVYARAWKGFREDAKVSTINNIRFQVSKNWALKPVAEIEPVELDGVTVSNVTLNNAKFIEESEIGVGSEVSVVRSGQVIPKIISVIKKSKVKFPETCPSCNNAVDWNKTHVDLICSGGEECDERNISQIVFFFDVMGVENLGPGIVAQLYTEGYKSAESILNMSISDFAALDSFKEKKSEKIYLSIREKTKDVPLENLMHASSLFDGLGSKKLALLREFNSREKVPDFETLKNVDGFSDISAQAYLDSIEAFWNFTEKLNIIIAQPKEAVSNSLADWRVCFSGYRDKELENVLQENGAVVVSGVSSKTTHLIVKQKGSGSSKERKALHLEINIFEPDEFKELVNSLV